MRLSVGFEVDYLGSNCLHVTGRCVLCVALVVSAQTACRNAVEPTPVGYDGEWIGMTAQGTPVRFSVSGNAVTSISIAYNFSPACTGTLSYTNLAAEIHTLDPPGPPPFDQPGFGYSTTDGMQGTLIAGHFSADRRSASGQFTLVRYGACETVVSNWTANRR
ncbi:MAG TPA: hypothetical protein VH740_27720 [Vicinamibacterales bacterium]